MLSMYPATARAGDWYPGAGGGLSPGDEPEPPDPQLDRQANAARARQAQAILLTRIVTFRGIVAKRIPRTRRLTRLAPDVEESPGRCMVGLSLRAGERGIGGQAGMPRLARYCKTHP